MKLKPYKTTQKMTLPELEAYREELRKIVFSDQVTMGHANHLEAVANDIDWIKSVRMSHAKKP